MPGHYIKGRNGAKIRLNTPPAYKPNRIRRDQLDINRIIGIDTETIIRSDKLKSKFLQLFVSKEKQELIDIEDKNALDILFQYLLDNYGEHIEKQAFLKQRSKQDRIARKSNSDKEEHDGRDGRRQTLTPILLAFFNMQYDMGRLLDEHDIFKRFVLFGQDANCFTWNTYQIEIVYSVIDGGSPSFQWIIKDPSSKRAVRVYGFDGTNYYQCSLKEAAKSLESMGVPNKIEVDKTLFTRDWNKKAPTKEEIKNFKKYSTRDAEIHKSLYLATVDILCEIDPYVLNKQGMIGMSAGGSAWRMIMNLCDVDHIEPPMDCYQQLGYNAYYGAISFCLKKGNHDDISIIDISSAYPHVMTLLPAFETCKRITINPVKHDLTFKNDEWGIVCVSGESFDDQYPPLVTQFEYTQVGIFGKFENHWCTIPEVKIGVARGALRIDSIFRGYVIKGPSEGGLKKFINKMYHLKSISPDKSPIYNMSKLLMNSPYGKMIEKRKGNYSVPVIVDEIATDVYDIKDEKFKKECKQLYIEKGYIPVYEAHTEYLLNHDMLNAEKLPQKCTLQAWLDTDLTDSGIYFNADYAAQITGFTRAKLMAACAIIKAVQGDTDSAFFEGDVPDNFLDLLNSWGAVTPEKGLGSFKVELEGINLLAVKRKVYTATDNTGKIVKQAKHAMLKADDVELEDMNDEEIKRAHAERIYHLQKDLLEVGEVKYKTKPKPIKMREAWKRGITCGKFLSHVLNLKYHEPKYYTLDDNEYYHLKRLEDIKKEEEQNGKQQHK